MLIRFIAFIVVIVSCVSCQQEPPRQPSATKNVEVLATSFTITALERERTIRLYLPPNYAERDEHYPVLYMHDGQNLFDNATSYAGEWGVDETLNQIHQESGFGIIVVGIDNGAEFRMNELSPWPNKEFGVAQGQEYMEFIVKTIKPYIDSKYRTLKESQHTAIVGSSMGGLISHYAIFQYPHVFSKAGIFSPSYWFTSDVGPFSDVSKLNNKARLYLLVGEAEGGDMVEGVKTMAARLSSQEFPPAQLVARVVKKGEHNEAFWRSELKQALSWLYQID